MGMFDGRRVLVLGHAPDVHLPALQNLCVVACNASLGLVKQADAWVTTTHMFSKHRAASGNGPAKCEFIRGSVVGKVWLYVQHHPRSLFDASCRDLNVAVQDVEELTEAQRFDFVQRVAGCRVNVSTGVFGGLAALHEGASEVILAGISLKQKGYAGLTDAECRDDVRRNHVSQDRVCLLGIAQQYAGRVHTTSNELHKEFGVPLWK